MSHNNNLTTTQSDINTDSACELCARTELPLTRHHLIPLARHNKTRTQRHFSRVAMKTDIAMLCRPCHSQVHRLFDNHELASYYHSVERLQAHSEVKKFINWVKKRPAGLKIRVRH
ncbi:HNH endonuclease [Psychrobacter sp. M13]|uniref:HNH endonuclease n=1 Tax=Psychrobacter sp. M13 TaxID=3067275 RepID=UPI00273CA765|nr:HNH endonuclease [Psychrobacter sp. M13]WLP94360.1 HNH endonuclease [Psychrobacter sp. M13]